jgi:uncharacterized protein YceK
MKVKFIFIIIVLVLSGCSSEKQVTRDYPIKPPDTSGRKAGAAMLLYEKAEEDLDVTNNVTVTPPPEKKKGDKNVED